MTDDGLVDRGTGATRRAMMRALARTPGARSVVLVEGISDLIAVEALADRRRLDLAGSGVVVVPIEGAHAIRRFLDRFGPEGADVGVSGLCDAGEEAVFASALDDAGLGPVSTRAEMEQQGFFVCTRDLEDELIRAAGRDRIARLLHDEGDARSFRTLQKQQEWRDRDFSEQMHRWMRAGARRGLRYSRLLVEEIELDRMPRPLDGVLHAALGKTLPHEGD